MPITSGCKPVVMLPFIWLFTATVALADDDNSIFQVPATSPAVTTQPTVASIPGRNGAEQNLSTTQPSTLPVTPVKPGVVATTKLATATQPVDARLRVPSSNDLAESNQEINEVFKADMADSSQSGRRRLGEKLIVQAANAANPDEEFALLERAQETAQTAGDVTTAVAANDRIVHDFAVDSGARRTDMLIELSKFVDTPADCELAAQTAFSYVDDAIRADDYGLASKILRAIKPLIEKAKAPDMLSAFRDKTKLVHDLAAEAQAFNAATAKVRKNPNDPAANLVIGRFYCMWKNDWPSGLPFLAKGASGNLKLISLAELDNSDAHQADTHKRDLKLADQWWDYADTQTGSDRIAIKTHAESLYLDAQPGLTGLAAVHAQQRLDAAAALQIKLPSPTTLPVQPITSVEIAVDANHNASDPFLTGVRVLAGQSFTLEPNPDDKWCGGGTHQNILCDYHGYPNGRSAWMVMKWRLGSASGTVKSGDTVVATEDGEIQLYAEDGKPQDNTGSIRTKITVLAEGQRKDAN